MAKQATAKGSDVTRNEQVVRILMILHDLDRGGGSDLYTLAERYGTTTRTVRRDLEAIEQAGIPLNSEPGEGARKRWRLDPDASKRLAGVLEISHFLALRLAMEESPILRRNENLYATMEDLAERLEKAIGPGGRAQLRELVQRLHALEVLDETEALPPEYALEHSAFGISLGSATERYALRFDAFAKPSIEERSWHPSEVREAQADGSVLVSFECTPSDEVTSWVASWREHVEVLAPQQLREALRTYGSWLVETYASAK